MYSRHPVASPNACRLADVGLRNEADVFVKKELLSEEEGSESSKEPNNGYASMAAASLSVAGMEAGLRDEENNRPIMTSSSEPMRVDAQKILSETLESAGLAHYTVLPLCPIKEEDINSEQHVVIVLPSNEDVPLHDRCSEGASLCMLPEERLSGIRDLPQTTTTSCTFLETKHRPSMPSAYTLASCHPSEATRERMVVNENMSTALFPTVSRREGTMPVRRLFDISPAFDASSSSQYHRHRPHHMH